jgi:hypothetical protein
MSGENPKVDETLLKKLVEDMNTCVKSWYRQILREEYMYGEFIPCCSPEEFAILRDCAQIALDNLGKKIPRLSIYIGVITFYYINEIFEYYVTDPSLGMKCFNKFKTYAGEMNKVVKILTTSDEEWASRIRRKILFTRTMSHGGRQIKNRKNKTSKRKFRAGKKKNGKSCKTLGEDKN